MLKIVDFKLPKEIFGKEVNLNLLAQAIHVYEDGSHTGLRKTKTRAEVNRTTRKVYKQKGTGGARHGSRRANVYVGGGVALGPRPLRRILELPKGVRKSAKVAAYSAKSGQKEILVVSGISKISKTKEASEFLKKLDAKRFTFIISEKSKIAAKFLRNLSEASTVFYKDVSVLDIWRGGMLILDEEIFNDGKKAEGVKPGKKIESSVKVAKKSSRKVAKQS